MNLLKKAMKAIFLCVIFFGCMSNFAQNQKILKSQESTFQEQPSFQLNDAHFQEWYAGIKVGGTGFNIILPNITNDENIVFQNVYFRNLTGKVIKGKGKYSATLKNSSPDYTWEYPEKPADYPFDLTPDECVISYKENGQLKYLKIAALTEKAGAYYENGPPLIYDSSPNSVLATVDDED